MYAIGSEVELPIVTRSATDGLAAELSRNGVKSKCQRLFLHSGAVR